MEFPYKINKFLLEKILNYGKPRIFSSQEELDRALERLSDRVYFDNGTYAVDIKRAAKSCSLLDASLIVDGANWLHSKFYRRWAMFSPKAMIALAKLTHDIRWAAAWWPSQHCVSPIEDTDLDWRAVSMAEEAREKGDARAYLALACPEIASKVIFNQERTKNELVKYITPHFSHLSYDLARRIFMGESPVSISGGFLTRKEAHQWLLDGADRSISGWLSSYYNLPYHHSLKVVRWLQYYRESGRWHLLERQRSINGRECSLLDVIDEVQTEDIITGRDGVAAVIDRIAERMARIQKAREAMENYSLAPVPEWAERLPSEIRLLNTPAALIREGDEMDHCVGSYTDAVRNGECYILSISTREGRSTVKLSPSLEIVQHKGPSNSNPPARNERLLRTFINRIKKEMKNGN